MKAKTNLPILGVGPYYTLFSFLLTFLSIFYTENKSLIYYLPSLNIVCKLISFLFIIIAIVLWGSAIFFNHITSKIKQNKLVTDGVYGYVRHPIYSAFLFMNFSILLASANILLFPLLIIHWIILSLLLIYTEEKWLLQRFQNEYIIYSKCVNRCIPWFPSSK